MRFGVCILVLSLALNASAQLIPPGLPESIVSLTNAITELQTILNATNIDVEAFAPQIVNSGNRVGAELNALSSSTTNIYNLGTSNLPAAQDSLAKAANALQTLANFTTTVQNHQTPIIFAIIGALATGILLGQGIFFGFKWGIKTCRSNAGATPATNELAAI